MKITSAVFSGQSSNHVFWSVPIAAEANTETVAIPVHVPAPVPDFVVPAPVHDLAETPFTQGNFTCYTCGMDLGEGCAHRVCGKHGFCDLYFLYS
jgi:hypothetical protein